MYSFWCAFCLIVLAGKSFSSSVAERINDSVAEYGFSRSECLSGQFRDISQIRSAGYLDVIPSNNSCNNGNGIGNQISAVSTRNVSKLQNSVGSQSYSLELWIQPQKTYSTAAIFAIGSTEGKKSSGCSNHLEFSQDSIIEKNGIFTTSYSLTACSKDVSTGYVLTSPQIPLMTENGRSTAVATTHIVIIVTYSSYSAPRGGSIQTISTYYYVDSMFNETTGFQYFASSTAAFTATGSWSASDNLKLLPPPITDDSLLQSANSWNGTLHYLAFYNRELSQAEISQNYLAKLPNSLPVVINSEVTVQENGEVGDHSEDPAFYQRAEIASHELAVITLSAVDADDDPGSPNYGPTQTGPTMRLYITHLPIAGTGLLHHLDGTPLPPPVAGTPGVQVPFDADSRSYAVRFRPPLDQYSIGGTVLSCFTFHAIDGVTGLPSAENATISIVVTHVDKPPVPDAGQSTRHTAEQVHVVFLRGTDVDSAMVAARIVTLPTHGRLYRVHPNGTASGQQISAAGTLITGPYPVKVAYVYTGLQLVSTGNLSDPMVGADSLQFKLVDVEGRESLPGAYNFTATTAITATPSPALISDFPNAVEGRPSVTPVYGYDVANTPRPLHMRLLRVPSRGRLVSGWDGGATIPVGGTIGSVVTDYKMGTTAYYQSDPHYFTHPRVSWNGTALNTPLDSFDFLMYATDEAGVTVAESTVATQFVAVKNVNDPSELRFKPSGKGGYSPEDGAYKIHAFGSAGPRHPSKATFSGFTIMDPDRGVDQITVSVRTSCGGLLSLNSKTIKLVDFNTQTYCYGNVNWRCAGDGLSEPAMVFIGTPWAVQSALNGMTYESLNPNIVDTVNVTINDGEGGACLSNTQHGTGSLRSGCYSESVLITVNVLDFADINSSNDMNSTRNNALGRQLMFVGIGLLVTLVLAVSRCVYLRVTKEPKKGQWCVWVTDCKRKADVKEGTISIEEFSRKKEEREVIIRRLESRIKELEERKRLHDLNKEYCHQQPPVNGASHDCFTECCNTAQASPVDIEKGLRFNSLAPAINPTIYSTPPGRRGSHSTATDSAGRIDDHYPVRDDYLQYGVMSDHLHSPPAGSRSLFTHPAAHDYGVPPVEQGHHQMGGFPQRAGQYERPFVPPSPQSQYCSPQRVRPQHNMRSPTVSTSPQRPGRETITPQDPRSHRSPTRVTPPRPLVNQVDRSHGGQQSNSTNSSKSTRSGDNGGWSEHTHRSGKTFYYNTKTHQSTWSRPAGFIDRPQQQQTPPRGTATSAMETVCM